MADEADKTDERTLVEVSAEVAQIQRKAQEIKPGNPGECVKCGEDMPRLINGVCCPCRDRFKLP